MADTNHTRKSYMSPIQLERIENGLCFQCSTPRGVNGTTQRCRTCANKVIMIARRAEAARRSMGLCIDCGVKSSIRRCSLCLKRNYNRWKIINNGEARLNKSLKAKYGISVREFRQMVAAQNGKCAICKRVPNRRLAVDHDHASGLVRGLLCFNCNSAIGLLGDNLHVVKSAVMYLQASQ